MSPQCAPAIRKSYDSDLSDAQWRLVRGLVPAVKSNRITGGRPAKYDRRELLNAMLYVARTGCQWRLLPHDLPDWQAAYRYFISWHEAGVFEDINARLARTIRISAHKHGEPSVGIIDSQSVKISANIGFSGFDGAKKVNGRKRHIVVDTLGFLLAVVVHEGSISDRDGARLVLVKVRTFSRRIRTIFADQGYTGKLIFQVKQTLGITLAIVKRIKVRVFHILPKRWIVERTFAWFGFYRRLAKEYERYPCHSEAFVYLVMSNIMLHRLAAG